MPFVYEGRVEGREAPLRVVGCASMTVEDKRGKERVIPVAVVHCAETQTLEAIPLDRLQKVERL